MAMPQRDETIEEIKRLDLLLEYAVMHGDEAEIVRYSAALPCNCGLDSPSLSRRRQARGGVLV